MDLDRIKRYLHSSKLIQKKAEELNLIVSSKENEPLFLYDQIITNGEIRKASRKLFDDGYYALAVEESYKCLNNSVKSKSKSKEKDGYKLMFKVFDEKNPILKINDLRTQSEESEQIGYKYILAGVMTGIRNPRAHQHQYMDDPDVALEMIGWANHLVKVIEKSKKTRMKRKII